MKNISRTAILGIVATVLGFGRLLGVDWDEAFLLQTAGDFADLAVILFDGIVGPAILWLRKVTSSPMLAGVKGLIFKQTA